MKHIFIVILLYNFAYASFENITSFKADFVQSVTNDKGKVLTYEGNIIASKPQKAVWNYIKPVQKHVYVNRFYITLVEPEIEQVTIRKISSKLDFLNIINKAKRVEKNKYEAQYKDSKFIIETKDKTIESISYVDEFDNNVKIIFKNQKLNISIKEELFTPTYPSEFDIIRD